ncbi:MAG: nucleotidyl transferase AbiEii/AbiGii toxin family protein [Kiritimatiellia bacterium]
MHRAMQAGEILRLKPGLFVLAPPYRKTEPHPFVLASLARAGLFADAIFLGDTCLRIVNQLGRFSEDLDFLLKRPDPTFRWQGCLEAVRKDCAQV